MKNILILALVLGVIEFGYQWQAAMRKLHKVERENVQVWSVYNVCLDGAAEHTRGNASTADAANVR